MLQTPHHFFSPDPFERNLGRFRQTPNEGTLFYGLVQDGNDMWDATFFCGSCAILRRSALDEIGGIAVETVTEDAHTSLRLHRRGHTSAYIRIPQAAGLATESLSAHRPAHSLARGMVQIFRLDNPLLGRAETGAAPVLRQRHAALPVGHSAADLPHRAAGVFAAACLHHLRAGAGDRALCAAAHDPRQPDQLAYPGNTAIRSGAKSMKPYWLGISRGRRR